jgi:bis(5'-nucleosyl)-tetraphosphatase (symmetrical)
MANYAIGDVHGCFRTFRTLLEEIRFQPETDRLWFVGDLVNKGPDSLSMLRWAYRHRDVARLVLGNHDLHLLRVYFGLRQPKAGDRFEDLLSAEDAPKLIRWLRRRPLVLEVADSLIVHAGILPAWNMDQTVTLARRVQQRLDRKPRQILATHDGWSGHDWTAPRLAGVLRVFTAVRCCADPLTPDFAYTGSPEKAPDELKPWFTFPAIDDSGRTFIFGHWAGLGLRVEPHAVCLDTGCIYGGPLSAWRIDDRRLFQVPNQNENVPMEGQAGD